MTSLTPPSVKKDAASLLPSSSSPSTDALDAFRAELLRQKIVFDAELRRQRESFEDQLLSVSKALADRETDCRNLHAVVSILGKKVEGLSERLGMIRSGTPQKIDSHNITLQSNSRLPSPARSERSVFTQSTTCGVSYGGPHHHQHRRPASPGRAPPSLYTVHTPRATAASTAAQLAKPPATTLLLQQQQQQGSSSAASSRAPSINQIDRQPQQQPVTEGSPTPQPATSAPQPTTAAPRHVSPTKVASVNRPKLTVVPKVNATGRNSTSVAQPPPPAAA
jgi:hypothetical protein